MSYLLVVMGAVVAVFATLGWAAVTISRQWAGRGASKKEMDALRGELALRDQQIKALEKRLLNVEHIVADAGRMEINRPAESLDFKRELDLLKQEIREKR